MFTECFEELETAKLKENKVTDNEAMTQINQ